MCGVRRFRGGDGNESGKPGVRARCPYAAHITTIFARVQTFDAPRATPASNSARAASRISIRLEEIAVCVDFFGPSKRGPPVQYL